MTNVYTPPGVSVVEQTVSPSISPLLASPADICIIGVAGTPEASSSPITVTDTMILTGTSAQTLPTLDSITDGVLVAVNSVTNVLNPGIGTPLGAGYVEGTDYTVDLGEGPPDGTHGTITRIADVFEVDTVSISGSPTGGTFTLSFTYEGSNYTTGAIAYNATASAVAAAVLAAEGGPSLPPTLTGSGGPLPGSTVTLTASEELLGAFTSQAAVSSGLTGGTAPTAHYTSGTPGSGSIPNNTLVAVNYTYLPDDYWNPVRLFDIGSVERRFGATYSYGTDPATGQSVVTGINSQLSLAARLAFENGANNVICQPLFYAAGATPGTSEWNPQAPTAGQVGDSGTWADTLKILAPIIDLDIIVPIVGNDGNVNVNNSDVLAIFQEIQSFLYSQNQAQQYIVGIFGEDGTSSQAQFNTLLSLVQTHAADLQAGFSNALSSQMVLINNTVFQRTVPGGLNTTINIGGQYAAAAVAGALGGRPVAASLTRAPLLGFASITDPRTTSAKNTDAGDGLMVIEQVGSSLIRIRQGNTLDINNGPPRQELSVVRAKFLMMESIMTTINNQIIGQIIADANSPLVVSSAIAGVLGVLQQTGALVSFSAITASLTSLNPTTITASFSYKPAFPLNFVDVTFSLDLTSATITVVNDGSAPVSVGSVSGT